MQIRILKPALFILLIIFPCLVSTSVAQTTIIQKLVVQSSSKIVINGKTTVNKYTCTSSDYLGHDTLIIINEKDKIPIFQKGLVKLPVSTIDCEMDIITNDFLKTIKSKDYPELFIDFITARRLPKYDSTEEQIKCKVKITLAGTSCTVDFTSRIYKDKDGFIHLHGRKHFKFSDFKLLPPKKMMGLVKVHDTLDVEFHLVMIKQ